jgi:HSP90 family molecular chaperone
VLQVFIAEKRHGTMQKLFVKKEEKELRKNGQVSEILKTMGTQMPT